MKVYEIGKQHVIELSPEDLVRILGGGVLDNGKYIVRKADTANMCATEAAGFAKEKNKSDTPRQQLQRDLYWLFEITISNKRFLDALEIRKYMLSHGF